MPDYSNVDPRTPVMVGVAQYVQKCEPDDAKGPIELLSDVGRRALKDAGATGDVLQAVDTLVMVNSTTDEPAFDPIPVGRINNPPKAISKALGIEPKRGFSTYTGGNTPQMLVNHFACEIAEGRVGVVLTIGGEVLASQLKQALKGVDMNHWGDGDEERTDPAFMLGSDRDGVSKTERDHGLGYPPNTYPIFESAQRKRAGRSLEEHSAWLGEFMHPFTATAAKNPYAWFDQERSPLEISTATPSNRMVGFPYTKYLNSVIRVDQGGAFVMMSAGKARELGVPEDHWVFLHGCADTYEIWNVTERVDLATSPAIRVMGEEAFEMAGWVIDQIDYIDLYSCFPSAVGAACAELGIATDDPRGLTVTGGLPYFGGAGNAYVMCSIAQMVTCVRDNPGNKGLVTGNGWYLTKHAMGLYSTDPIEGKWSRKDPLIYQQGIDEMDHPVLDAAPDGEGVVEGYTVVHARDAVRMGIVIGMLDSGKRFIAHVPFEKDLLERMEKEDLIGVRGRVTPCDAGKGEETNTFVPQW
jgi:acetyl-CoA C-acetyltransferase